MPDARRLAPALTHLLLTLLLTGCQGMAATAEPSPTAAPAAPPAQPTLPLPTPTEVAPDTGWETFRPGLERRVINLISDNGEAFEHLFILRLDPALFQFDVAYHPQPQSLGDWQSETDALIVINGGYFRLEDATPVPNGLTIVDGRAIGRTYGDFGGMLAVTANGPELRWLAQDPYDPDEPLLAALQSFPVLVKPGGLLGFPEEEEDNRAARRSVIGMDRDGRVVLIVASLGNFTLHKLSAFLVDSDLDLDIALNLDGGPSSGMLLAEPLEEVPALVPLPIVITVSQP